MSVPWWVGIPDATATVLCAGEAHRLRWHDGSLVAESHGETAGGAAVPCLDVVRRFRAHQATTELATLWRRPGEELDRLVTGWAGDDRRGDLLTLLSLPPALLDRLLAAVLAASTARWDDAHFRARHGLRLGATLATRATPALHRLAALLAADAHVTCAPAGPGEPLRITARGSAAHVHVDAWLPVAWLSDVWARGISEVDDRLVLAVRDSRAGGFDVDVAEWREARGGGWEVAPVPAAVIRAGGDGPWQVSGFWSQ